MKAIGQRDDSLSDRRRSNVDAERLGAIWRISQGTADGSEAPLERMLAEGAAVLRPGQSFFAQLTRVEDDVLDVCGTRSWDDMREAPNEPGIAAARMLGVRALIVTPVRVGPAHYTISFASQAPLEHLFGCQRPCVRRDFCRPVERALQHAGRLNA